MSISHECCDESGPNRLVITVDGPMGVGKSVLAKRLAQQLKWVALDTGAMYRAVAWKALESGISLDDAEALAGLAASLDVRLESDECWIGEKNVSGLIRTSEVSAATPLVARHDAVRRAMFVRQKDLGKRGKLVCEGRDMGTVVFPDAAVKFYLTASCVERAARRNRQMQELGQSTEEDLVQQLIRRDGLDRKRSTGALRVPGDACVIDSTNVSEDFVLEVMAAVASKIVGDNPGGLRHT